jgi:endogenous inhibitor of DNA gyrase (YacG/DUF329 family)
MEVKCPTCGKTVVWEEIPTRPFCSERCQLIDFGAWADEEYRVPIASDQPPGVADTSEGDEDAGDAG